MTSTQLERMDTIERLAHAVAFHSGHYRACPHYPQCEDEVKRRYAAWEEAVKQLREELGNE